ncbi:MAG: hypothetical protein M1823_006159 [Watsoniomyces obsoletus]|nr:MAG: hypothetical protein M1823_006159 [Watsoniomyces obsoletus]
MQLGHIALLLLGIRSAMSSPLSRPESYSQHSKSDGPGSIKVAQLTSPHVIPSGPPQPPSEPQSERKDDNTMTISPVVLTAVVGTSLSLLWFTLGYFTRGIQVAELRRQLKAQRERADSVDEEKSFELGRCLGERVNLLMTGPTNVRQHLVTYLLKYWDDSLPAGEDVPPGTRPIWRGPPELVPEGFQMQIWKQCADDRAETGQIGAKENPWSLALGHATYDAAERAEREAAALEASAQRAAQEAAGRRLATPPPYTSNNPFSNARIGNPKAVISKVQQNVKEFASVTAPNALRQSYPNAQKDLSKIMPSIAGSLSRFNPGPVLRKMSVAPR